ncbi:MAG: hypothetical protein EDM03_05305 [Porphyrobacter sp. IPPAS B-1204]|nr:MAG: hypothetical protein EDM03_05305 [Porphyrobacter sp. IPPAS B-1204]
MKTQVSALYLSLLVGCSFWATDLVAQESPRPLPANTAPGLVETRVVDGELIFQSIELERSDPFQVFQRLPLAEMKGDRAKAKTSRIGCSPANGRTTCLIDATFDGQREIWFFRKENEERAQLFTRLPSRAVNPLFWISPSYSLAGNGPLSLAAPPLDENTPAKVWVENTGAGSVFFSYALSTSTQVVMARPSFNGVTLSGLFVVLSPENERYITPAEGVEIIGSDKSGHFSTYAIPPNCEVLGSTNDTIVCGENSRGHAIQSAHPFYPKVMKLALPEGVDEDITRAFSSPAFQALGDSVLLRGMQAGVARPFLQRIGASEAIPALIRPDDCILSHEHVDVFDLTASENAALMRIVSPLKPTRFVLAPVEMGKINICATNAQLFREDAAEATDHSKFKLERLRENVPGNVPVTLVSGPGTGALQGHLMMITYAHAGLWLPEGYLGPWLTEWVLEGGKIAFVHLPGGGGFGAEWSSSGFGIRNKIKVAQMFDEVSAYLVDTGVVQDGKISVMTESGGGPVAANAILRNPERYAALALRAPCLAIEWQARQNCAANYDHGNWYSPDDRPFMDEFEPLERMVQSSNFPLILFGIPESDTQVDIDYQQRMARALGDKVFGIANFKGVNHTERGTPEAEREWVRMIAEAAVAAARIAGAEPKSAKP